MQILDIFKVSAVAAALTLAGCGGDVDVNEGDTINENTYEEGSCGEGATCNIGGGETTDPDNSEQDNSANGTTGFDTTIDTAVDAGLATDVSADPEYSAIAAASGKKVYLLSQATSASNVQASADGDGVTITSDVSLTNDAVWVLDGRVAVGNDKADSATLFIQQGTTIIGETGEDFLVVRRGSKIQAVGTAAQPITFTSIQDESGVETGAGQWGGIVLLGNAPANSCGDGAGEATDEELLNCGVLAEGDAGAFGGNDPEDDSGALKYVVVKHAGKTLGNGDELNGISFAGIGSGTDVSYIQVHENLDDGIEFFGGTVNVDHVVLTDIGDDSLDWSFGWTGTASHVYIQQSSSDGDNAIEADNHEDNYDAGPQTNPNIDHVTIIGADGTNGARLRAGTQGSLANIFITGSATYDNCLRVNSAESVAHANAGDLNITNSIVACETPANNFSGSDDGFDSQAWFEAQTGNSVLSSTDLMLEDNGYMPKSDSPLLLSSGDYIGAFNGTDNWMDGWAVAINGGFPTDIDNALAQGYATDVSSDYPELSDKPVYMLTEDATFTTDVTLTNDAYWILQGRTAVGNDKANSATLYVQAGTTLIGLSGDDFLVVRRGSQISASGTAAEPITMTSIQDVIGSETGVGQWGGLVLLGNAPANSCGDGIDGTTDDELANCGVLAEGDAGAFGGNEPEDNSGILRYVVVKHAGKTLGNGDELNGISFAGVGSATKVEYIQVHENLDDGIEFFGGTVSVRNVVLTSIGDDSLDWSFGWTGNAQNVYIQQSSIGGDNAIEADNHETNYSTTPQTNPTISNVTIVGASGTNGARLRAGTQAMIRNVAITGPADYAKCLRVNSDESVAHATTLAMVDGVEQDYYDLSVQYSAMGCDAANNFSGSDDGFDSQAWFTGQAGNNVYTQSELLLATDGFTPKSGSPLLGAGIDASELGSFFTSTDYIGAFDGDNNWMEGWTVGIASNLPEGIDNAFVQGLATDVSADYSELSDKPVYMLGEDTEFNADVTLTNDAYWVLNGRTAVGGDNENSATLYVQEGTTLIGETGEDFLVVRRGSKIEAVGTATKPIVLTSLQDVVGLDTAAGQWGGLVLLGNAPANSCGDGSGEATADELLNCGVQAEGDAGNFGGNQPEDNSGTLKYVVVKHAGKTLGNGDELNGISFAGIGSGTEVDYIHVHQNLDDGIEFFGGTVSVSHVVLTAIGDDSLDWSFGWTGNAQYVLIKQDDSGDNAIEGDNHETNFDSGPQTNPTISNVTIIGADGVNGARLRAGTQGMLKNVVITGPTGYEKCLRVNSAEAVAHANAGDLGFTNSVMACETPANNFNGSDDGFDAEAWFTAEVTNDVLTPTELALDNYQPEATSPLLGAGYDSSTVDSFFDATDYIGAMDETKDWTAGWVTAGLED